MCKSSILSFIKRVWLAYALSLLIFSVALTAFFSVKSVHTDVIDMLFLAYAIFGVTLITTAVVAMPIVFLAWLIQQRRGIVMTKATACLVGFFAGTLLHITVQVLSGYKANLDQTLILGFLLGGGCGLIFNWVFFCKGGFELTKLAEQDASSDR